MNYYCTIDYYCILIITAYYYCILIITAYKLLLHIDYYCTIDYYCILIITALLCKHRKLDYLQKEFSQYSVNNKRSISDQ